MKGGGRFLCKQSKDKRTCPWTRLSKTIRLQDGKKVLSKSDTTEGDRIGGKLRTAQQEIRKRRNN